MKRFAAALLLLVLTPIANAQIPIGTWVKRPTGDGTPALIMIVTKSSGGLLLTYKLLRAMGGQTLMTVGTALDGIGWGVRIRTCVWRDQNPLPYHLATPQQVIDQPVASG